MTANLPNVGIFTTLMPGVRQVVPFQGTMLGWWSVIGRVSCHVCVKGGCSTA